jgi:hypothetical protein
MQVDWKLTIPLQKSEREDGWYIRGVAAGTEPDLEGDVLTENCIRSFATQINESPVPFKDWHAQNTIMADMGLVEKAWLESGSQLGVEIRLDEDHPSAQYLWKQLGKGKQYGLSVEGGVTKYEFDTARKSKNGFGRNIDEVTLREVSCTTKPVYTPSFGTVLRKALDEAIEAESVAKGETTSMPEVTPQADPAETTQTPVAGEAVAPTSAPAAEETTAVEKAVVAETAKDAKMVERLVRHLRESDSLLEAMGLKGGEIAAPADSQTTTDTAKSEPAATGDDLATVVKSLVETIAAQKAAIEDLKERIPEVTVPGVVHKSQEEEAAEAIAEMRKDPRVALRAALAAQRGEIYNG